MKRERKHLLRFYIELTVLVVYLTGMYNVAKALDTKAWFQLAVGIGTILAAYPAHLWIVTKADKFTQTGRYYNDTYDK